MLKQLELSTVQEVIRLADRRAKNAQSESGIVLVGDASAGELHLTPEEQELEDYLRRLPGEQMAELMALMWLGRGAGGERKRDYPELVKQASQNLGGAVGYVAEKTPLADYLRRGLAYLE